MHISALIEYTPFSARAALAGQKRPSAPEPPGQPPERSMEPPVPLPGSPPEPEPPLQPPPQPTDPEPGAASDRRASGPVRLAAALLAASLLPGCTTPATTLRNPRTGQVASCGGNVASSFAGGMVGYSIQKSSDERCVAEYSRLGFVPVR